MGGWILCAHTVGYCILSFVKYFIICKPEMASLNKRNELSSCCRHARKFMLKNVKMQ